MNEEIREIAERISGLREACGYTREEMAGKLGVDIDTYISYEESGENIPISTIYEISKLCGVDFAAILTGTSAKLDNINVVRSNGGQVIDRYPGYYFKDLAFRYANKIMQPLLVTIDPSEKPAALVAHKGEEFNLVLEGSMILDFNGKEIVLNQGDSAYFNPNYPHGQKCNGNTPVKFLTMIVEV